jgi:CheY-like chemotaxis protein
VRCLVVDDYAPFLEAASRLLALHGIAVVGAATTSAEALRRAEELRPEVILVDINLGAESGFELAEQLHRDGRSAPETPLPYSHNFTEPSNTRFLNLDLARCAARRTTRRRVL